MALSFSVKTGGNQNTLAIRLRQNLFNDFTAHDITVGLIGEFVEKGFYHFFTSFKADVLTDCSHLVLLC